MPKFRKKPVEVEAIQYDGTNRDEIVAFMGRTRDVRAEELQVPAPGGGTQGELIVHTLEGDTAPSVGDWIIRGVQGECYPCKPDIFEATYDKVD
jgi:hypothetical protein